MADYESHYSGPQIDEAIGRALSFKPEEIGVKKILTEVNSPQNLNDVYELGYYTVEHFSNGPANIGNVSPIQLQVTSTREGSGAITLVQTIPITTGYAFRTSTNGGSDWSDWTVSTDPAFLVTGGSTESVEGSAVPVCKNYTITSAAAVVANNAEFRIRLHAPNSQDAKITVNGKGPYDMVNSMGQPMQLGDNEAGAFVIMYFNGDPINDDNSNIGKQGKFHLIGAPTLGTRERNLIEEYNIRMHGLGDGTDDTQGKDSVWWDIDTDPSHMVSPRILAAKDLKAEPDPNSPRRVVAAKLTLEKANALDGLANSMMVLTDAQGRVTTTDALSTDVIKSISALRNESNKDKLIAVGADGNFYATGATKDAVEGVGKLTASKALTTDGTGKITASTTDAAKIDALQTVGNDKAMITDAQGKPKGSAASATQIDSIGSLAASQLVMTDASKKFVSVAFPKDQGANIVWADPAHQTTSTDTPALS